MGEKQAVALHKEFYATLPELPEVAPEKAEIAWFLYDLEFDESKNRFNLVPYKTVYTAFEPALLKITTAPAGRVEDFIAILQTKLDEHLENNAPVAPTLQDMLSGANQ